MVLLKLTLYFIKIIRVYCTVYNISIGMYINLYDDDDDDDVFQYNLSKWISNIQCRDIQFLIVSYLINSNQIYWIYAIHSVFLFNINSRSLLLLFFFFFFLFIIFYLFNFQSSYHVVFMHYYNEYYRYMYILICRYNSILYS